MFDSIEKSARIYARIGAVTRVLRALHAGRDARPRLPMAQILRDLNRGRDFEALYLAHGGIEALYLPPTCE